MEKISIIIPAYNEEIRISNTIESYYNFFKKLKKKKKLDFEILIILNACTDTTPEIVKKYSKKYKEVRHLEFEQGGKGFAVIEGFKDSLKNEKNSLIGFIDADMATIPKAFFNLIENINDYDGIIANRWKKNSEVKIKQSILRRILSRGFNFLVRSIFMIPYTDTQCGAKLFKAKSMKKIAPEINITNWAFDVEILYSFWKKGFKIKEHPTIWEDRVGSKINVVIVPLKMFIGISRLRLLYSPFNFIVRAYDKFPESIKLHHKL